MSLLDFFRSAPSAEPIAISGPGDFFVHVVGESSYQGALHKICGPPCNEGYDVRRTATLVLENDNRFDSNAVCVEIDAKKVGYLSRDNAADFRAFIQRSYGSNSRHFSCAARIKGGWDRGGTDRGHLGVTLDLPRF